MSSDTGTVAFCPGCGEVHPEASRLLSQHLQDMRTIGALKAELSKQRKNSPQAQQAKEVFEHWVGRLGKNRNVVFGPAREKAVLARLKEFPLEVVLKAVDGCALMPYVGPHGRQPEGGKGAKKHDDLSLICRDETTVERFAGYVDEAAETTKLDGPVEPADRYGTDVHGQVKWHGTAVNPDWSREPGGLELLLRRLDEKDCTVKGSGAKYAAQCPAHDDRERIARGVPRGRERQELPGVPAGPGRGRVPADQAQAPDEARSATWRAVSTSSSGSSLTSASRTSSRRSAPSGRGVP
jgi:hypothetical protein